MPVKRSEVPKLLSDALYIVGKRYGFDLEKTGAEWRNLQCGMPAKFSFTTHLAWGCEVTLTLYVGDFFKSPKGKLKPQTELSWSSTDRSLPMAMTAVANYQKAIAMAAELETILTVAVKG